MKISENRTNLVDYKNSRAFDKEKLMFTQVDIPRECNGQMIVYEGRTYMIGGGIWPYSACFWVNSVDFTHESIRSLNQGRKSHGLVVLDSQIYAIGGIFAGDSLKSVEKFNGKTWLNVADLNYSRVDVTAIAAFGKIYAVCGDIEENSIEVFENHVWRVIGSKLRLPLRRVGVVSVGDSIFIAGGNLLAFRTNCNYKQCTRLNCLDEKIYEMKPLESPDCFDLPGWVERDTLKFIGLNDLHSFNLAKGSWTKTPVPYTCKFCFGSTCKKSCDLKTKVILFKLFKILKPQYNLI